MNTKHQTPGTAHTAKPSHPPTPVPRHAIALAAALAVACGAAQGQANPDKAAVELAPVTIAPQAISPAEKDKLKLEEVAGATAVVDQKEIERGRASNLEDQLVLLPGVFAQSTSGNGANRISIRGSGLNTFYGGYSLGIKYLYDGLPITGPGGTHEDLLTANGVSHTEVLYGGNAFAYTALSLGGAINFVTHTGRTSPGHYVRLEGGSFGYGKAQVSTGGVVGKADYYLSYVHNQRDGYQDFTENSGKDYIVNLGYALSPQLQARLILRHRSEKLLSGSTLNLAQIQNQPTLSRLQAGRLKPGTTLVTLKADWQIDDRSRLEAGVNFNDYPLHNGWIYSATPQDWRSKDTSLSLRYLRTGDKLFGRTSDTTVAFSHTRLNGDVKGYTRATGALRQYTDYDGSSDTVLALGNELQLSPATWLSTGVSLSEINRDVRIVSTTLPNPTNFPLAQHYRVTKLAPRIGLRHEIGNDAQVFGNISRSIDPPVTWYYGSTGVGYVRPQAAQEATTVELGIKGRAGILDGSLTVYRSAIRNELLSVVVIPAVGSTPALIANYNASPTLHQGVELGLNAKLWEQAGQRLALRQAYTLNDFKYRNDAVFGSNELPSLPKHVYQAELQYQSAGGLYAHLNVRAASSYFVDYANTLKAPSYAILGAKVGYEDPGKVWTVFLDARNLTDKRYVTTSSTAYDLKGVDSFNFYPGDGRSFTVGVSFRF